MDKEEYREISLKPIAKTIGLILLMLVMFLFYEAMAREFSFFDEFSVFAVLLVIAIRQNAHLKPPRSEE